MRRPQRQSVFAVTPMGDGGRTHRLHPGDGRRSGDYGSATLAEVRAVNDLLRDRLGVSSVDAFLRGRGTRVAAVLPDDVQVVFELDGAGGGAWTVHRTADGIKVEEGKAVWPDSVLRCSVRRFVDLVTGKLDGRRAFFDGTVCVEGDVGLLLRLGRALPQAA